MTVPALSFLDNKATRIRYWWPMVLLVAVFSYFYSLDGLHIPKIGDEAPYFHITHLTAESGHWLPLQGEVRLRNTKPPLLFWQGMIATNNGSDWTLARLRLPVVFYSLLTALLAFLLAQKLGGDREQGFIAALTFLGFASTFQHGRPFLTNMPETFFVFLCLFLLVYFRDRREKMKLHHWAALGLLLGMATLYRSFVVVVPVGFALFLVQAFERNWKLDALVRDDLVPVSAMIIVALFGFALWPLLDPQPELIFRQFIVGENIAKLGHGNYFLGLFSGDYPLTRIWLGHLTNAGILMFVVIGAVVLGIRNRQRWGGQERMLWLFVLAYLVVYSIPSQRQENYLLPTTPALAVLISLYWHRFRERTWLIMLVPVVIGIALLMWLFLNIPGHVPGIDSYTTGQKIVVLLVLFTVMYSILQSRHIPFTINLLVVLAFIQLSIVLSPFEGVHGRYSKETLAALDGRTVYMPAAFGPRRERYRFLLPNVGVKGYSAADVMQRDQLLRAGHLVGAYFPLAQQDFPRYRVHGKRLDLRTRQSPEEVKKILFEKRLDLLFRQELIVSLKKLVG